MKTITDPLSVKVPKSVFDSLQRVRAALSDRERYSIRAALNVAKRNGETAALEWIALHEFEYGEGVFHGFYVDLDYPGPVDEQL